MLYTFPVSRTFLDLIIKIAYSAPVPGSINALTLLRINVLELK